MRMTAALFLLILAPLFAVAATPVVNSGTINYSTNQIMLTGSGFEPNKTKPTVAFNGSALTVSTFSNTQVFTPPSWDVCGFCNAVCKAERYGCLFVSCFPITQSAMTAATF